MSNRTRINPVLAGFAFMLLVFATSRFVVPATQPVAITPTQLTEYAVLGHPAEALHYSPNRQLVAQVQNGAVQLYTADFELRARIETIYLGIRGLSWSPDSEYIVLIEKTGIYSSLASLWSVSLDGHLATKMRELPRAGAVSWRPNSRQIGLSSHVYDIDTGEFIFRHDSIFWFRPMKGGYEPLTFPVDGGERLYWSHDGQFFVAPLQVIYGSSAYTYGIFKATNGRLVAQLENARFDPFTQDFLWSPNDQWISFGFFLWNASTGALEKMVQAPNEFFSQIGDLFNVWSQDSSVMYRMFSAKYLIGPEEQSTLRAFNVQTGALLFEQHFWQQFASLRITNGELIADTPDNREVVFDSQTGEIIEVRENPLSFATHAVAWNEEGTQLVTAAGDNANLPLRMWDIASVDKGETVYPLWTVRNDWHLINEDVRRYGRNDVHLYWREDGIVTETVNFAFGRFSRVGRWNEDNGTLAQDLYWIEEKRLITNATFSSDGQLYALDRAIDPEVDILSSITGLKVLSLPSYRSSQPAILPVSTAWSSNSRRLATFQYPGATAWIMLWDVSGASANHLSVFDLPVREVAWSPDDSMIAMMSRGRLYVANVDTGEIVVYQSRYMHYGPENQPLVTWSPDNRHIAVAWDGELQIMDVLTDSVVFSTVPRLPIRQLAWSPTGTTIASVYRDGTIGLWRVE